MTIIKDVCAPIPRRDLTDADIAFLGMVHTSDDVDESSCWVGHYKGIRKPWASWAARQIRVTNASPSRVRSF